MILLTNSESVVLFFLRGRIPKRKSFYEIALAAPTDKVITHHYEDAFERFLSPLRDKKVKLFEIGLGCGMVKFFFLI